MRKVSLAVVAAAAVVTGALAAGGAATVPVGTVVMSGLDNPRHLVVARGGSVYVAEAGRGGPQEGNPHCIALRGQRQCAGDTGAISRLERGVQRRIVTGLPSYAPEGGNFAFGPHAVSVRGRGYATIGLGGDGDPLAFRAVMGEGFGRTVRFSEQGEWSYADDIAAYEVANNPDGSAVPDSNPYDILQDRGDRIVTDAGANVLLRVRGRGRISTLAVFPSRPQGRGTDAVPTSVAVGRHHVYYVGELTGAPFVVGASRVYRVAGGEATVHCAGFTSIIDIVWGPDDRLYVLQFATGPGLTGPGILYRVEADCARTPVVTDLIAPGGIAFGEHNSLYISQRSVFAGVGEVLRFRLAGDDHGDDHGGGEGDEGEGDG
jgi:hypothetical protein